MTAAALARVPGFSTDLTGSARIRVYYPGLVLQDTRTRYGYTRPVLCPTYNLVVLQTIVE